MMNVLNFTTYALAACVASFCMIEVVCTAAIIKGITDVSDKRSEERRAEYRAKAYKAKRDNARINRNRIAVWECVKK